jgi:hypothetical protein
MTQLLCVTVGGGGLFIVSFIHLRHNWEVPDRLEQVTHLPQILITFGFKYSQSLLWLVPKSQWWMPVPVELLIHFILSLKVSLNITIIIIWGTLQRADRMFFQGPLFSFVSTMPLLGPFPDQPPLRNVHSPLTLKPVKKPHSWPC